MYFQGPLGIDVEQGKLSPFHLLPCAGNECVCTFFQHIRVIPKKGFFMRLFIIVGIYHGKQ